MKKLFTIALSVLMLISCFTFSVSAAEVNYAQNETTNYAYITEDTSSSWYGNLADDLCELLNDGNIPYLETPFESVGVQGSNRLVTVVFDLGAIYPDIKSVKFCGVWDSYNHGSSGKNRSFSGEKTMIEFSEDGMTYTRNKDFEMTKENWSEDGSENGFYNFVFTFGSDVKAKAVRLTFWSPTYVMSLGEIQIIGGGADPVIVTPPAVESSEEIVESYDDTDVESEEPAASEEAPSTEESVAQSEAEVSTEESKAEESKAEEASKEESKAEESKTESKAEESKDNTTDDKDGISPVVIVVIIVAVIAIAAVVVIIMKKKGK
jgi:hypothetical protein